MIDLGLMTYFWVWKSPKRRMGFLFVKKNAKEILKTMPA